MSFHSYCWCRHTLHQLKRTQGAQDGVTSAGGWKTRLTVGSFQVDNHMARAHFPVVLRPADEEDGAGQERAADKYVVFIRVCESSGAPNRLKPPVVACKPTHTHKQTA